MARGALLFIRARGRQGYQQGGTMLNYVIKRLLGLIPTLLIVAVLVFLFICCLAIRRG